MWFWWVLAAVGLLLVFLEIKWRRVLNSAVLVEDKPGFPKVIPHPPSPVFSLVEEFIALLRQGGVNVERAHRRFLQRFAHEPCLMEETIFFGMHKVTLYHLDAVKQVLATRGDSFAKMKGFSADGDAVIGESVVSADGEKWKHQREVLNPSFKHKQLMLVFPKIIDCASQLLDKWEQEDFAGQQTSIEPFEWMKRVTLDALGKAVFGHDFGGISGSGERQDYHVLIRGITNPLRLFSWYRNLSIESNKKFNEGRDSFQQFLRDLVEEKRQQSNKARVGENKDTYLLDMLISAADESGAGLSETELLHNVMVFFMAGHETTTAGLGFAINMLEQNPEVMKKAQEEVDTVLQGNLPNYTAVKSNLPYITAVIKESLRLYPPVPVIGRTLSEDTVVNGYALKKGTIISIPSYSIHRFPTYWDEPDKFKPDRFLPNATKKPLPNSWLPFSTGPRQCLGNNFAMLEMKAILAMLLQKYTFVKDPKSTKPFNVVVSLALRAPSEHTIRVQKRK